MTSPQPLNTGDNYDRDKRRWLDRYLSVQAGADTKIRTVLLQGAEDARNGLLALEDNSSFSAGVRSAQLRISMRVIREVHSNIFKKMIPIINDGHRNAADAAVDGLTATDRRYLQAAFGSTSSVNDFVDGQRKQAELQVANAISRVTRSDIPLSGRVYRSRSLANGYVQRLVTSQIMRGGSARDIAAAVRSHILPTAPGGTSYVAMRLGRTELNNAFHATTVELTKDRPWIEANRWNLSKRHTETINCKCESYARIGLFGVDETPRKPHPQCRCFVTPELEPFESFVTNLNAGYYRGWTSKFAAA